MAKVYLYVLDTLADWEIGHVMAELGTGRFFKKEVPPVQVEYVGCTLDPVVTMGGLSIVPNLAVGQMAMDPQTVLLLPGADTWGDPRHIAVVEKAVDLLGLGGCVAAICGATIPLAAAGVLDCRPHTSNGAGFLDMFVPTYRGSGLYVDAPSVADGNLVTAGSHGSLLWAKQILERLDVMSTEALDAWYEYYRTGDAGQFFALMQAVQG